MTNPGNSLIQIVEVWTPDEAGEKLLLSTASYGRHEEFSHASHEWSFGMGEGVPGKVWETRSPVIVPDVFQSHFARVDAARQAGVTSLLALPVVEGDHVRAVVMLICDDSGGAEAAFEVWSRDNRDELGLSAEFYANLQRFSQFSKHVKFPRGASLPGLVWEDGIPRIANGLTAENGFSRASGTGAEGLDTAVGIPIMRGARVLDSVVVILSSSKSPVVQRFESWTLDPAGGFKLDACSKNGATGESDDNGCRPLVMRVSEERMPMIDDRGREGWSLAVPVFSGHEVEAIVTLTS